MKTVQRHIGGSFAPPVDDAKIDRFEQLAKECSDSQIQGYMLDLVKMLRTFRETPESQRPGSSHPSGVGTIVPLEDAEIERIWDVVPWPEECDVMGRVFDKLPAGCRRVNDPTAPKGYRIEITDQDACDRRNAAYHLLWFARELAQDREPLTNDKL